MAALLRILLELATIVAVLCMSDTKLRHFSGLMMRMCGRLVTFSVLSIVCFWGRSGRMMLVIVVVPRSIVITLVVALGLLMPVGWRTAVIRHCLGSVTWVWVVLVLSWLTRVSSALTTGPFMKRT